MKKTTLKRGKDCRGKMFCWVVEFRVHESWVADGFDITPDGAKHMLEHALGYSEGCETEARVLAAPMPALIRKAQGYPA